MGPNPRGGMEQGLRPIGSGDAGSPRRGVSEMKVNQPQHTSFVVERDLPGSPGHAFRFWAEPHLKARWNSCHPDWTILQDEADFRVGGAEAKRWRTPDGDELAFHAFYL